MEIFDLLHLPVTLLPGS